MSQTNIGKAIFYGCCITISYTVSTFIRMASSAHSELYMHCHIDLNSYEILCFSISIGILSSLDALRISFKMRRVIMFSCISYFFLNCYAALLRASDTIQLNLLELILRKEIHPTIILGSEFLLILITKTIVFSLFQEIIRSLNRMIDDRSASRRSTARKYIYVPDSHDSPNSKRSNLKRVKFSK